MTSKPTPIRCEVTGEIEHYEFMGRVITRDETARNGGRWSIGNVLDERRFPTLAEAARHISGA